MANTDWKELLAMQQRVNGGNTAAQQPTAVQQPAQPAAQKTDVKSLSSTINPAGITQSFYKKPTNMNNYESGRPVYTQSQAVTDAANALQQQQAAKPGEYVSTWNDTIQSLINEAMNRPKFQYDFSEDPIYQMYADKYQLQGQQAMKGAMGESAALTGGYGNSYAQQAGQQAYQNYMLGLNDIIPTLRDQAYQQYQDEGDRLYQNLNMLQTEEDREYGRYRDTVSDWRDELNFIYTMYTDMSTAEYNRYLNDRQAWETDRDYWMTKEYNEKMLAAMESGGGGSSGGGSGGNHYLDSGDPATKAKIQSAISSVASQSKKDKKKTGMSSVAKVSSALKR